MPMEVVMHHYLLELVLLFEMLILTTKSIRSVKSIIILSGILFGKLILSLVIMFRSTAYICIVWYN